MNNELYLSHHGVVGMHWGIRRYQNADGTLSEEGKRRYLNSATRKLNTASKYATRKLAYDKSAFRIEHPVATTVGGAAALGTGLGLIGAGAVCSLGSVVVTRSLVGVGAIALRTGINSTISKNGNKIADHIVNNVGKYYKVNSEITQHTNSATGEITDKMSYSIRDRDK